MKDLEKRINRGEHPSRLELGRLWSGELQGDEAQSVRARAEEHPPSAAWLESLDESAEQVQPFDAETLRKRAFRLRQDQQAQREPQAARPARAWWRRWMPAMVALGAAAAVMLVVLPPPEPETVRGTHRAKGEGEIDFYLLRGDQVHPGSEDELHYPGDRVQFTYRTVGDSTVVIVSLDGRGELSVYYPSTGDDPVPVVPGERRVLEGSIELDDAPDFELVLAFFGAESVGDVLDEVEDILDEEGREGLLLLAEDVPDVDAIYLMKGEPGPTPGSER